MPVLMMLVFVSFGYAGNLETVSSEPAYHLENRDFVGKNTRYAFWRLINQIKLFDGKIVEDMWKYSFRGFAIYVLNLCTFPREEYIRITKFIEEWEAAMLRYAQIKGLVLPEAPDPYVNNDVLMTHVILQKRFKEEFEWVKHDVQEKVDVLGEKKEWMAKYEQLQVVENIVAKFKLAPDDTDNVDEVLDDVLDKVTDKGELEIVLRQLMLVQQKLFPVNKTVEALALVESVAESDLKAQLAGLRKSEEGMKKQTLKLQTTFNSKTEAMLVKMKKELKKDKDYTVYSQKMKRARKIEEEIKNLNIMIQKDDELHEDRRVDKLLSKWKRIRVPAGSILKIEDDIEDLREALNLSNVKSQVNLDLHEKESYIKLLKEVVVDNDGYKDLITTQLEKKQAEMEELQTFRNLSLKLDSEFARVMALLMSGDSESGKVFFTSEELSVLIYFMNISKVIYSQEQFLTSLFMYMTKSSCQNLVTRMRLDILELSGVQDMETDPLCLIEDPNADPFHQTTSSFIRDYALLLSSQKSFIFQDCISVLKGKYLAFSYYMSFLGITPTNVQTMIRKTLYVEFFKNAISMLFVLLDMGSGVPFLISSLTVFMVFLVEFILGKINKSLPNYTDIKNSLMSQMDVAYKAIFVTDFENLNYQASLRELEDLYQESFFSKLKKKPDELKDMFVAKFGFFEREPWIVEFLEKLPVQPQEVFRRLI